MHLLNRRAPLCRQTQILMYAFAMLTLMAARAAVASPMLRASLRGTNAPASQSMTGSSFGDGLAAYQQSAAGSPTPLPLPVQDFALPPNPFVQTAYCPGGICLPPPPPPGCPVGVCTIPPPPAPLPICPAVCLLIPLGSTAAQTIASFEASEHCVATAPKPVCPAALDRINLDFTIHRELGGLPITTVDVPCYIHLGTKKIREKGSKKTKTVETCTLAPGSTCSSGVTVSAGVDLSFRTVAELNGWGINATSHATLFKKLTGPPSYLGLKSCAAALLLHAHPLQVTTSEADYLDHQSMASYVKQTAQEFQSVMGYSMYLLPPGLQTALFDHHYLHGNNYFFYPYIRSQNWKGIIAALPSSLGKEWESRLTAEATLIRNDLSNGSLVEFASCLPAAAKK